MLGGGAGVTMIISADWPGLMNHDYKTLGNVVAGALIIVLGYFTNRIGTPGSSAGTVPAGTPVSKEAPNIAGTPTEIPKP